MPRNRGNFRNFWSGLRGALRGWSMPHGAEWLYFVGAKPTCTPRATTKRAISRALKSWIISTARDSRAATAIRPLPSAETPVLEGAAVSMCAVFVPSARATASDSE